MLIFPKNHKNGTLSLGLNSQFYINKVTIFAHSIFHNEMSIKLTKNLALNGNKAVIFELGCWEAFIKEEKVVA